MPINSNDKYTPKLAQYLLGERAPGGYMQDATTIGDNEAYDYIEQKVAENVQNKWPTLVENKVTEALSDLSNEVQSIENQIGTGIDDENNTIKKDIASIDQDLQNIHINIEIIENTIGEDENASEHENETQTLYQKINLLEEKVDTISSGDWSNLILKEEVESLITSREEKTINTDEIPLKNKNYYILNNDEYILVNYLQDFQLATVQENIEYNENYIYYIKERVEDTYEPYEYNENTWESDLETGNIFLLNGQDYTPIEPGAEYIEPDNDTSYWWRIINYEYNEYNYNENTWTENIALSLIEQCLFKENIEYYTDYEDIEVCNEIARIGGKSIYDKINIQNYYDENNGILIAKINDVNIYTQNINIEQILSTLELAEVATTGDYNNLINTPNLSEVAVSGDYNDLLNSPTLSKVATTGNYNDLADIPTPHIFNLNGLFSVFTTEGTNFKNGLCAIINDNRVNLLNLPKNNLLYSNLNTQNYLTYSTQTILISNYIMTNCEYSTNYEEVNNQEYNSDNLYFLRNEIFELKIYQNELDWQNDIADNKVYIYDSNNDIYIQLDNNSNYSNFETYYYKVSEQYIDYFYTNNEDWEQNKAKLYYKELQVLDSNESAGYGFWVNYDFILTNTANDLGLGQYKIVAYKDIINNTLRLKRINLGTV